LINPYKEGSRVQRFKGSEVQGFRGSRVQRFKGSGFRPLSSNLDITTDRSLLFFNLGTLNVEPLNQPKT
jgi:hypothetical protein